MAVREIVIPYAPRPQFAAFHARSERFAVGVAHRRAGKTVACINDLVKGAITNTLPNPRSAYVAPLFNQAKDVAWNYLKQYAQPILAKPPNESELYVELLNGARIRLYGADNPDRLRGIYLDDVVLDEFADMHPAVWGEVIRPLLADRKGRATFIGTPKGRNALFDLFQRAEADADWFRFMLRASETKIIPQSELDSARQDMTPEQYEQEFECSFEAAIVGAYFGREIAQAEREGRLCEVAYDPNLPVHTAWDLGVGDSTAIWFFQVLVGGVNVIDAYENHGFGPDHYVAHLNSLPYRYGDHWLPHDAAARMWVVGAKTRIQQLHELGLRPKKLDQAKKDDEINAGRLVLAVARFDKDRCAAGLEALRQYRREYDDKARAFRDKPKHDWTSHYADAWQYLALAYRAEHAAPAKRKLPPKGIADITFEQLMARQQPRRERV